MSAVHENGGLTLATFGYDDLGRRTSLTRGNGATTTYGYDTAAGETRLSNVSDPSGAIWGFVNTAGSIGFVKPGQGSPWLTNQISRVYVNDDGLTADIVNSQSFADGESYTYNYNFSPDVPGHVSALAGGTYSDAQGHTTSVIYDFPIKPGTGPGDPCQQTPCPPSGVNPDGGTTIVYQMTPGPVSVTDPLNRTTSFDYCDPNAAANLPPAYHHRCSVSPAAVSATDPEGIKTFFTWDFQVRNLLQTRQVAKPGSGLADIVRSASYDCRPATIRYCQKPVSVTDANGNTTRYTYAPEHGGVLTETQPAVNGATPQKRYTYEQRYAWLSNGAGGYVRASSPAWLPTQMSLCKSGNPASWGTGCDNGSWDEVVTTYDYGPDTGPNNLLPRGTVVDAGRLSLRTCYAYDALGNKISETTPRAGLTSCP